MARNRLLIVDDESRWLRTIDRMLGSDYELTMASDPSAAMERLREGPVALAILDQRLTPETSGVDLLVELQKIQPRLAAIILTGYAEVDDAVVSIQSGAYDYVSKGQANLADTLRQKIAKALDRARHPDDIGILISQGESRELEFKGSARWDRRLGKQSTAIEIVIVKTIAGFLNSEVGGRLLIGVADTGDVVGLDEDYSTLGKKDRDGFELFLVSLLLDAYGKDIGPNIVVNFHHVGTKDVCNVSVRPSPRAVFVRDGTADAFYLRTGNSTRQLSTREAIEYCKSRWR